MAKYPLARFPASGNSRSLPVLKEQNFSSRLNKWRYRKRLITQVFCFSHPPLGHGCTHCCGSGQAGWGANPARNPGRQCQKTPGNPKDGSDNQGDLIPDPQSALLFQVERKINSGMSTLFTVLGLLITCAKIPESCRLGEWRTPRGSNQGFP